MTKRRAAGSGVGTSGAMLPPAAPALKSSGTRTVFRDLPRAGLPRRRLPRPLAIALGVLLIAGCEMSRVAPASDRAAAPPPSIPPAPAVAAGAASPTAAGPTAALTPGATAKPQPSPSPVPQPLAAQQELAFVQDGNIVLARADGRDRVQLTRGGPDRDPQWAPDGARLIFVRGTGAAAELHSVWADRSQSRRLTNDSVEDSSPRWSPNGDLIAYVRSSIPVGESTDRALLHREVWLMNQDGGSARRVASGFDPAWSPDGRFLAYATNAEQRTAASAAGRTGNAIRILDVRTGGERQLLSAEAVAESARLDQEFPFDARVRQLRAPSWAVDGRRIALSADGRASLGLSVRVDGTHPALHLLNYAGGVGRVLFAPRGEWLAIESRPASGFGHVQLVDTEGGQRADLGSERLGLSVSSPTWSADGRRLAVVGHPGPLAAAGKPVELLVFSRDGSRLGVAASGATSQPAWNPAR